MGYPIRSIGSFLAWEGDLMSSFIIGARTPIHAFKLTLATVAKRVMSTTTIAVIDQADLKDGQMCVFRRTILLA
jgi:hypothetical protein